MPLQGAWAASTTAFNNAEADGTQKKELSLLDHGSHQMAHRGHDMNKTVAKTMDHCDNQQAKCDQCDNCSHCINLLDSRVAQSRPSLQSISVNYFNHYHSIDQHSLFRPPIRS